MSLSNQPNTMPTQLEKPLILTIDRLVSRSNEESPFEDENGKFYLSLEHFYQASKFENTDPVFAEHVRLTQSADEAKKLAKTTDHPSRSDWKEVKDRYLKKAFDLKIEKSKDLQEILTTQSPEELTCNIEDCDYRLLQFVLEKREELIQKQDFDKLEQKSNKLDKNKRKGRKKKNNIYTQADGSVTFDMVSSDAVRISVTDEDVIIPMSAIPARAKTVAKNYQFFKKNHPEAIFEESDEDEIEEDEIDPECEQFIFKREDSTPITESKYSNELLTLLDLGFADCDANYAALLSTEGNVEEAIEYLLA